MSETRNSRMVYTTPLPPPSCFGYNENHTELKVESCFYGSEFTRTFEHAHLNLIIFISVNILPNVTRLELRANSTFNITGYLMEVTIWIFSYQ